MIKDKFQNSRIIHAYIISTTIIIILIIVGMLMLKYNVEGEKNLPFNLSKISIVSTAEGPIEQNQEGIWCSNLLQKNDVFFYIEKNHEYKKEEMIKKISFNNFQIIKETSKGNTHIYKPSLNNNLYSYSQEYIIKDSLEYKGTQTTDTGKLQINNQGGLIGFSIATTDLGQYAIGQNEKIVADGTLLKKADINLLDIQIKVKFDFAIETESGNVFKTNVELNLPTGDILEEGVCSTEDTKLENIIFKR